MVFPSVSELSDSIYNRIQRLWYAANVQDRYIEVMSAVLAPAQPVAERSNGTYRPWMLLPCWCCQAAGEDGHSAEPVAAAWGLLYTALHILDDIEDGDLEHGSGVRPNFGQVLNASTGLIASSTLILHTLQHQGIPQALIGELVTEFHSTILNMCQGQHRDLGSGPSSLQDAWDIAALKSGIFFALACRAGARLATQDRNLLEQYGSFGHHLGMLIQIGNDLDSLSAANVPGTDLMAGVESALPAAYAMSVLPPGERFRLHQCLQAPRQASDMKIEARKIIRDAGAVLYLSIERIRHYQRAQKALDNTHPSSRCYLRLMEILQSLVPGQNKGHSVG